MSGTAPILDDMTALRLQIEWGADEALADAPLDRFAPPPAQAPPRGTAPRIVPAPSAAPESLASLETLDALHAAMAAYEGCPLRMTATHTVRPDGNPQAGLVLVGDAPGADDDRSGRAFSGAAGQVLDQVLASIGLDRSQMLLATVSPWRPPGNRPLAEAEVQACLPFLLRLLALVRPRRLVLLGALPVRALTGSTEPVRRLRGRWLDATVPAIETPIPALALPPVEQWMRSAASKRELWGELLLLRDVVTTA